MMLLPSRDRFLTQLQETGRAEFTITSSDDLSITIPTVVELVSSSLGCQVRIFSRDWCLFRVEVKD